jgi:hypothetical protein
MANERAISLLNDTSVSENFASLMQLGNRGIALKLLLYGKAKQSAGRCIRESCNGK